MAGPDLDPNGLRNRRAVLGDAHVDRTLERVTPFGADWQALITRSVWGDVWGRPGLARHARSLLTLGLMAALGREEEFKLHVRATANTGVSRDEIKEVLIHTALYCGIPAGNAAFRWAEEAMAEMDAPRQPPADTRNATRGGTVVSCLRYRDAPAAIDFLCLAFGFERRLVVPGEGGTVAHAELTLGTGMIMLGSANETEFGRLLGRPDIGSAPAQSIYVIVADPDAHCATARTAGAEVVIDLKDEAHGGRSYTCRDPEGNVWTFGSYDPWR